MKIENQAVMFALLCKYAIIECGERGREVIQEGMVRYGRERGARMAKRAASNGDPIELWTNQAYGEWRPDYDGQMEFEYLRREPTLVSCISRCAWCDAWNKFDLLEYGREYCVNVDAAVYDGFDPNYVCTPVSTAMSWGGERCEFDWGRPLSDDDLAKLKAKKAELGTSAMREFDFHTAHIYYTITRAVEELLPDFADGIIARAVEDYIKIFGRHEYVKILEFADERF